MSTVLWRCGCEQRKEEGKGKKEGMKPSHNKDERMSEWERKRESKGEKERKKSANKASYFQLLTPCVDILNVCMCVRGVAAVVVGAAAGLL